MAHGAWKAAEEWRRATRLVEAIKRGFLAEDELEGYVHIPDEPDRKWTDRPSRRYPIKEKV
jgi:hypothetical protein